MFGFFEYTNNIFCLWLHNKLRETFSMHFFSWQKIYVINFYTCQAVVGCIENVFALCITATVRVPGVCMPSVQITYLLFYISTPRVSPSCDLIFFIFMRSSKLHLICVPDLVPPFPYMCTGSEDPHLNAHYNTVC